MDLTFLRQSYKDNGLSRKELNSDPFIQFKKWFDEASSSEPIPNAMSLSTSSSYGEPSLRTVLLKKFDKNGFVFFSNYQSRKAYQIKNNPKVALLFHWIALERQVSIEGVIEKVNKSESQQYFNSRPRGSQLGAWVSEQSKILTSRKVLENKLKELKLRFLEKSIPVPDFWGGYRVKPNRIEFWQGRADRLHDRFSFIKDDKNSWNLERLSP